tara:strand:- start:61291 stop:62487 length:1197 start_codon:yes stop_codon:yes gene_type:complete
MFSLRIPRDLTVNAVSRCISELGSDVDTIIDLTVSNPTEVGFTLPDDFLREIAGFEVGRYKPEAYGLLSARHAVARYLKSLEIQVSSSQILLTTGTSESYGYLCKLLCDPGDALLVPRPGYPLFEHLTSLEGVVTIPYQLGYEGSWKIDLAGFERAINSEVRAVVVVNPNNPTGSFVSRDEFNRILQVCKKRGLALIVDEVFGVYSMTGDQKRGPSILDHTSEVLTFVLGGFSKACGLPQIKLGWIIVNGPQPLTMPALERLELISDTYLSVNTFSQVATQEFFEVGRSIAARIKERIYKNYGTLKKMIPKNFSLQLLPVGGGWYAVLRVLSGLDDESVVIDLLKHKGVLVHPGYFFDFPDETFLVVSLMSEPPTFKEGINRLVAHVSNQGSGDCSDE